MEISELTLDAIKAYITGDGAPTPYMSGPELVKFFNAFGFSDEYSHEGLPNAWSRNEYTYERLKQINCSLELNRLIEAIPDRRRVKNSDEVASQLSEIIKYDGYDFEKDDKGIYRIVGSGVEDPILIAAHFQQIKRQIIEAIRAAKFTIWIAVAWFTDKDIGNELRIKHQMGVNVRIIVNNDLTTEKHGLDFVSRGIDCKQVSPDSPWGKKLMHNKFCIIDLYKVIHGSYNWTSNAVYNNESITITDSRTLAEKFSEYFLELYNQNHS